MSEKLFHMRSYSMNGGINVNAADISIGEQAVNSLPLGIASTNISYGRRAGISSRYGIWPVPGQSTTTKHQDISVGEYTGQETFGLMGVESTIAGPSTTAPVFNKRQKVYGAVKIGCRMGDDFNPIGYQIKPVVYWLCTYGDSTGTERTFSLAPSVYVPSSSKSEVLASKLESAVGFCASIPSEPDGPTTEETRTFRAVDRLHTTNLVKLKEVKLESDDYENKYKSYIQWAHVQGKINTNIKEFAVRWTQFGVSRPTADPGADPYAIDFDYFGTPYWCNDRKNKEDLGLTVMNSNNSATAIVTSPKTWSTKSFFGSDTDYLLGYPNRNRGIIGVSGEVISGFMSYDAGVTWSTQGTHVSTTYGYVKTEDKDYTVPIDIIAYITSGLPKMVLFNPELRDSTSEIAELLPSPVNKFGKSNDFQQWVDPTDSLWKPKQFNTIAKVFGGFYTEESATGSPIAKQTCWERFYKYIEGTNGVSMKTGKGVLKANTTYEFSYSIYNVMTGKESNVGTPAKGYSSSDGQGLLASEGDGRSRGSRPLDILGVYDMFTEVGSLSADRAPINYLYYRFYYRELGSFEWLFSGEYSYAYVNYQYFREDIYIGSGAIVGSVGGQSGGFNDYADLPKDEYIDVKGFGDRLFWLTKKSLRYSMTTDKLSYPAVNYFSCPDGEYKGMIQHYFAGQSKQDGRLVVFGSEGIYDGSFTGNLQLEQVRVSSTAQPQAVPKDGSDFELKRRGSETAFSGRTAVVAEGVLYFMGPTGIYKDSGVDLPVKISQSIEPDYFDLYDKSKTDEFFAYSNKKSREILFFYRPKDTTSGYLTVAWVYSLRVGSWTQYSYESQIDWAQNFEWSEFQDQHDAGGSRTLVGISLDDQISRVGFHDDDCPGGDMTAGKEFLCSDITKDGSDLITLTLAGGYSSTVLTSITAGVTNVGIQGSELYGGMSSGIDGLYEVVAKGASSIQILLDATRYAAIATTAFDVDQYFPIFVEGTHDISSTIETEYLCPVSLDRWIEARYLHMLFEPVPDHVGTEIAELSVSWSMNHEISGTIDTKTFPLTKLATGETTTQIYADLLNSAMTTSGQAIKYNFTYNQIFDRYTMYTITTKYRDRGPGEVKYYQRENG